MSSKRRALAGKHRPRGLRWQFFAVLWLLMDRLSPPAWVWGAVGTLAAIVLVAILVDFFRAEDVELPAGKPCGGGGVNPCPDYDRPPAPPNPPPAPRQPDYEVGR